MSLEAWERGIDKQLDDAQREGKFDNLPGKGKPLNIDENPHTDPTLRSAYQILKDNAFTLPWIAAGQQIDRDLDAARTALLRTLAWTRDQSDLALVQDELQRAESTFIDLLAEINKRIAAYNLSIPNSRFERLKLDPAREIEKLRQAG